LLEVQGQVLTSGVGKSGLVAKKIAATLTSTGTPATFVHPVDAIHGDLGIVTEKDAAILLSKSGETPSSWNPARVSAPRRLHPRDHGPAGFHAGARIGLRAGSGPAA